MTDEQKDPEQLTVEERLSAAAMVVPTFFVNRFLVSAQPETFRLIFADEPMQNAAMRGDVALIMARSNVETLRDVLTNALEQTSLAGAVIGITPEKARMN